MGPITKTLNFITFWIVFEVQGYHFFQNIRFYKKKMWRVIFSKNPIANINIGPTLICSWYNLSINSVKILKKTYLLFFHPLTRWFWYHCHNSCFAIFNPDLSAGGSLTGSWAPRPLHSLEVDRTRINDFFCQAFVKLSFLLQSIKDNFSEEMGWKWGEDMAGVTQTEIAKTGEFLSVYVTNVISCQ